MSAPSPETSKSRILNSTESWASKCWALLLGGRDAQIYDSARDAFGATGPLVMSSPWDYGGTGNYDDSIFLSDSFTATLLAHGQVLVAGGSTADHFMHAAMLYDPVMNAFLGAAAMHANRAAHAAVRLADVRVLIAGGDTEVCSINDCSAAGSLAGAELYDPSTDSFAMAGNMTVPRSAASARLLKNGTVLITGGVQYCQPYRWCGDLASAELYRP
jgi:hypothetical protein